MSFISHPRFQRDTLSFEGTKLKASQITRRPGATRRVRGSHGKRERPAGARRGPAEARPHAVVSGFSPGTLANPNPKLVGQLARTARGPRRDWVGEEDELAARTFPVRLQPSDAPRRLGVPPHAVMRAFNDRPVPDAAVCSSSQPVQLLRICKPVLLAPLSPHLPPTRGALSFPSRRWSDLDLITGRTFTPARDSVYAYCILGCRSGGLEAKRASQIRRVRHILSPCAIERRQRVCLGWASQMFPAPLRSAAADAPFNVPSLKRFAFAKRETGAFLRFFNGSFFIC